MDDLMERLRAHIARKRMIYGALAKEAAAEIERLRAKLAKFDRLSGGLIDEVQFMRNAARENRERAEAAEKRLAEAERLVRAADEIRASQKSYMADRGNESKGRAVGAASAAYDALRASAEWMEKGGASKETSDEDDEAMHLMSDGLASGKGNE